MQWYAKVFANYAVFTGRARRTEYWMFFLINFIISMVLFLIDYKFGLHSILRDIYGVIVFLPALAVGARRLHDIGSSGWWQLIGLIPFFGEVILIVFFCKDSEKGENKYGPNPKLDEVA